MPDLDARAQAPEALHQRRNLVCPPEQQEPDILNAVQRPVHALDDHVGRAVAAHGVDGEDQRAGCCRVHAVRTSPAAWSPLKDRSPSPLGQEMQDRVIIGAKNPDARWTVDRDRKQAVDRAGCFDDTGRKAQRALSELPAQ